MVGAVDKRGQQRFGPLPPQRLRYLSALLILGLLAATPLQAKPHPRHKNRSAGIQPQAAETADARGCVHSLLLRNETQEVLEIQVDNSAKRQLLGLGTARTCVKQAKTTWRAEAKPRADFKGWLLSGTAIVTGLRGRTVVLREPGGSVELVNHSGDAQLLTLDGSSAGKVKPGQTYLLGPIAPGDHKLLARGKHGRQWRPMELQTRAGETSRIILQPLATTTELLNHTADAVQVLIDGHSWGTLDAHQKVQLLGLMPGKHKAFLISLADGNRSELTLTTTTGLAEDERSAEVLVHVDNQSGEDLQLPAALMEFGTVVLAKHRVDWWLPRKTFGLKLKGLDSNLNYKLDMIAKQDPAEKTWVVRRPTVSLYIRNTSGEAALVAITGVGAWQLAQGQTEHSEVPAGRIAVEAELQGSNRHVKTGIWGKPGTSVSWDVRAAITAVTVHNDAREAVVIALDHFTRGQVAPGKDLRFDVQAGVHPLSVRGVRSGLLAEGTVVLRDGDVRTVHFGAIDAAMRLGNCAKEKGNCYKADKGRAELAIVVHGETLATVAPGKRQQLPIDPGQLSVQVLDTTSQRQQVWNGQAVPAQQVELPTPTRETVTVVVELAGQSTSVVAALDDAPLVTVPAHKPAKFLAVTPGEHLLHIRYDGREIRRRVHIDGHRPEHRLILRQEQEPITDPAEVGALTRVRPGPKRATP